MEKFVAVVENSAIFILQSPQFRDWEFAEGIRYLRQSRRIERFEPLKAVGGVAPVWNADLRGQKPMRRFQSPQGPALRAGQFSAAALWQAPGGKEMKGMRSRAFATVPPQKTPSEAPHRLLLADPRRTKTFVSAFISVSKYGAVKLFESPGRAGGLPM
jgi:hypothetical protein